MNAKYVKLNILCMTKKHFVVFLLILFSEILTVLCLFFSYGLFFNTRETVGKIESDRFIYSYTLPSTPNIKSSMLSLMETLGDDLSSFDLYIIGNTENDETLFGGVYYDNGNDTGIDSPDEQNVCRLSDEYSSLVKDGKIKLGNSFFIPKLETMEYTQFIIQLSSLTDDFHGSSLLLYMKTQPTIERINRLNQICSDLLGATCESSPEASDLMEVQLNNSFYVSSFLIVALVLINLSIYFRYIITLRRKQMRIMMICGASNISITVIYLIESLIELFAGFVVGFILYRYFLLDIAAKYYPLFPSYYSTKTYSITFLVYMTTSVLILSLSFVPLIKKLVSAGERRE